MSIKAKKIIIGGASVLSLASLGVVDLQAAVVNSPSGNVTARGEDGVPWELYENGFLLFKPVAGKDHLTKGSWQNHKDKVTGIGFSGKVYAPEDSSELFKDFVKMTYFDGAKFDVTNVSNMKGMFSASSGKDMILESVDFSNWETEAARDMSYMFANNTKLKRLDLHSWKLLNLRTMEKMFAHDYNKSGLESLNISNWKYNFTDVNTSNMFSGNLHLWEISLPYVFILDYNNLGLSDSITRSTNKWKREDDKFQSYTWSELGRNWIPAMAGTWVREPSKHTIEISFEMGTHPAIPKITGVYTANLDPDVTDTIVAHFTLPTPKNPENLRFIGWGGTTGGPQDNKTLMHVLYFFTDTGKATLYPKWEVIPKEPKTVTEVIEPTKEFVIDETRDKGSKNLETPGKKGSKTTKITYTINPDTGVATEKRGEPVIDPAGKTIVKVAAKPEVRQIVGNDGNKYEETTRYTVNAGNGNLTPNTSRRLVENTKAIEAINAEAKKKNDEIEAANITQEVKTRLKAKVEGERTKGIDAVKRMDTVEKGNVERDKALAAIRAISLDADKQAKEVADLKKAKDAGIDAIKKAAEDKKVEINAADLLPEAKSRLLAQVESEKNKGIDAVNKANNPRSVESETTKAVGIIKAISLEADKEAKKVQDAKASAINAIKQAAKEKTDEIERANILPEAKVRLKAEVEKEKNKGIDLVNKATTVANVNAETNKAVAIIKAISLEADKKAKETKDLGDAKNTAIDAIKKAAEDKTREINNADLLPEAKTRLLAKVEEEKNKGLDAVGKVTSVANVNSERDKAVGIIKAISLEADKEAKRVSDAKSSAIDDIKQAAKEKNDEIERANLFPEAKVRIKAQVEAEKNKGIDLVNKATSVANVNSEGDKAVGIIKAISLEADKKAKAAKDLADVKNTAIDAIKKAAADKLSEIEKVNILPEAKVRLRAQVETEKNRGINAVNGAKDIATVNNERDKAVSAIRNIGFSVDINNKLKVDNENEFNNAKSNAINEINKAAQDKKSEIDKADISPEDKTKLKNQVDSERDKGISEINKLTEVPEINKKKDLVIKTIKEIDLGLAKKAKSDKDLKDAKDRAIDTIKKAAEHKLGEIEGANLSTEAKARLRAMVESEKNKGIDAVDKATDVNGVGVERDKAVRAIEGISLDSDRKSKDLQDVIDKSVVGIINAANKKINEIGNADILPEAKIRLRGEVEHEKTKGIEAVKKAIDINSVGVERDKAIRAIEAITVDSDKKAKADKELSDSKKFGINAIEKAAREKLAEIENADLLPVDKEKLKGQVNAEKTKGIDSVNKAMTVSVAKSESDKVVEIIRGISLDQVKKAKQDLDNARRDAIKAVRDKGQRILEDLEKRNLDPKEKSRLRERINEIVDNVVKNIGVADRNGIDLIKNKAIKDLEALVPGISKLEQDKVNRDNEELAKKDLDGLKADAKKKVTDEYNRIKGEIERSSLDEGVKKELLKRLDDLYKKGLGLIDGAIKDNILKIRDAIISDMNKVLDDANARVRSKKEKEQLDLDKQKAKEGIKAEYEKQQNRIKSANIPAKLKAELLRELLERYGKGISDIDGSNKETLDKVTDDTVRDLIGIGDKIVAAEQEEAERLASEKAERERLAREKAEADRLAREKAERERLQKERLAREEADRLAREKAERERFEKERLEKEKEEADRLAREKAERERLEKERLAREEADRFAREKVERERLEKERLARKEADRLAKEKEERERLEKERLAREEADRLAREKAEAERLAREKAEADRLAREKAERERLEKERLAREKADRLAREKAERERLEKERLAKEKSNIKPVESKTATVRLEDVKPTVKQAKLPETGASETTSYGLMALALGLIAKLRRRKN